MTDNKKLSWPIRASVYFLVGILILSVISRFTASAVTPKIRTTSAQKSSITYKIQGTGQITSSDTSYITVNPDYRIADTFLSDGDETEENTPLFSYDMTDLKTAYINLDSELQSLKRESQIQNLEGSKLSTENDLKDNEDEITDCKAKVDEAKEKLTDAIAEWQKNCKKDYDQKVADTEKFESYYPQIVSAKRVVESAELACNKAESDYYSHRISIMGEDSELKELEYVYDQAIIALDNARDDLERARQDVKEQREKYTKAQDEAKKIYDDAMEETADNQTDSGKKADSILIARENLKDAENSLASAEKSLTKAKEKLSVDDYNNEIDNKIKNIKSSADDTAICLKEEELLNIKKLMDDNGIIYSDKKGVITEMDLTKGKKATDQIVCISDNKFQITGTVVANETKNIKKGDTVSVSLRENEQAKQCTINKVKVMPDGTAQFTADIDAENIAVNTQVPFEITVNLGIFNSCIPYQALRSDGMQPFVLVVREKDGILGKENYLLKIPVTITARNEYTVAVNSSLSSDDKVVLSSSKSVKDGDKVRFYD